MSTHASQITATAPQSATEPFLSYRPLLFSIAYRMLGSVADAEDALQETWLRWHRAQEQGEEIRNLKAWLTTTLSRICLDQLGSARVKREQYVGAWLPEPLAGSTPDVADTALDHESLSTAFLVLLESLSPKSARSSCYTMSLPMTSPPSPASSASPRPTPGSWRGAPARTWLPAALATR